MSIYLLLHSILVNTQCSHAVTSTYTNYMNISGFKMDPHLNALMPLSETCKRSSN